MEQDSRKAFKKYSKAAAAAYAYAQYNLAMCYADGDGVKQDLK